MNLPTALLLMTPLLLGAERQLVFPESAKPIGPYSPGILFDDVLYVSGQGSFDAAGLLPNNAADQTRQCLSNIRAIVEAAHMSMANIVYTHTYLSRMEDYAAVNKVYPEVFTGTLPARSTMGVTRMPQETPVEITAIAVRGTAMKPVTLPNATSPVPLSPGIIAAGRLFLSGILGRNAEANSTPAQGSAQIDMCLSRIARVLAAAQLTSPHLLHLNVYRTSQLPAAEVESRFRAAFPETALSVIEVAALPFGVQVGVTGVAALRLSAKRVHKVNGHVTCAAAGQTVYCAAQAADTAGEALRTIEDSLHAMGSSLSNALSTNVYLNDIETFPNMNAIYALQFAKPFPTRTTVQPQVTGLSRGVRIAVVAAIEKTDPAKPGK
jgi:2-iminobutanoate/2-iminopropanoate deaminase